MTADVGSTPSGSAETAPSEPAPSAGDLLAEALAPVSGMPAPSSGELPAANALLQPEALPEPDDAALRIAVLMPAKGSAIERPAAMALQGVLAANYASQTPARILLVYPGADGSVVSQLDAAVAAGAMAAVGPIQRAGVEELAALQYLPLPVVTLNQVDLDFARPLTPDEIEAERERLRAQEAADAVLAAAQTEAAGEGEGALPVVEQPSDGRISAQTAVPGFVPAEETAVSKVRYEPRKFPRSLLMLGLSMEDDAAYIARLGVAALPPSTESGEKPKVLLMDYDAPLEKRISEAFERQLVAAGFAPDRITVDLKNIKRVNQFFRLIVDKLDKEEFDEELIDQEVDPVGWRQQQIRIRRLQAAKRARAALSEPPYHAAFLAMDAKTASQVRSRLPIRSRVWGTPIINPGDTRVDPQAKAMTFDLLNVALIEAPMLLDFDAADFEAHYRVPAPESTVEKRLFALGADALTLAKTVAVGTTSASVQGETGELQYNLTLSPKVERRGQTAMIFGGDVRPMDENDVVDFEVLKTGAKAPRKMRQQARSVERLEREAAERARKARLEQNENGRAAPESGPSAAEPQALPQPAPAF